jgi:flagellar motor switch protein FliG
MNNVPQSTCDGPKPDIQRVAVFLRSVKRKLVSLELRTNQLRTGAIREAARLVAELDEGLEQEIIDACLSRQVHYEPAEEYVESVATVIESIVGSGAV